MITISLALSSVVGIGVILPPSSGSHEPFRTTPVCAREIAIQDDVDGRHEEGTDRCSGSRWGVPSLLGF